MIVDPYYTGGGYGVNDDILGIERGLLGTVAGGSIGTVYETGQTGQIPNITVTSAGVTAQTNKLDKVLNTILSGFAIAKGAKQIPTTLPAGEDYSGIYNNPAYLAALSQNRQSDGTASGKVENWLKNNTGVALMAAAGIALFLMKSPRR